jgi:glycosyltransferase involved in cell wall biosynthesis
MAGRRTADGYMVERGVLFIGHDASRAGAQIELLHFLRWFKRNGNRPFSILLGGGGELFSEFQGLAETWSMDRSHWHQDALRTHILAGVGLGKWAKRAEASDARGFAAQNSPALIYVNSVASARIVEILAPEVPLLTHVHELESYFCTHPSPALTLLLARTDRFIACSNVTRENLVQRHAVPAGKAETVYESIPVADIRPKRTRQQVFQELQVPGDALLIVGCGTFGWRKATDLFIQLARAVTRQRSCAYFAWIGDGSPSAIAEFEYDVRTAGLAKNVRRVGAVPNAADYMAAADVFVLTSREDPYPLVCLEAAALGKPIVCFAGAGGIPEFVEDDCGLVAPYLDIIEMADRIVSLLDAPDRRRNIGEAAKRKVSQRHDINDTAPRIMEIMERTIKSK